MFLWPLYFALHPAPSIVHYYVLQLLEPPQAPNLASNPRFFFFSSLPLGVREVTELW